MKKVTVADLAHYAGKPGPFGLNDHPCLHCQLCGATFSADAGDYGTWNGFGKDHVFEHCKRPMRLVFKKVVFIEADRGVR